MPALAVCLLLTASWAAGPQSAAVPPSVPAPPPPAAVHAVRLSHPPVIDGTLDDPAWLGVQPVRGFWKMRPVDNELASESTTVYLAYDHDNLYVAFHAYDAHPDQVRASLSARDQIFNDDIVGIFLDTFHDRRHGDIFWVNPLGIQGDEVAAQGQDDDFSIDFVWRASGRRTPDGYAVEIAIPFRSLRFPSRDVQTWGIALIRVVQHKTEQDIWPRVDVDNNCLLCQTADLAGLQGIKPGRTTELLPEFTGRRSDDRPVFGQPLATGPGHLDAGLGVKYGLTSNLTLDGALNPDFSQVESDAGQVTVNQRFALFYSEKRPFFLEGQDIFRTPFQLIYTRTIFDPLAAVKLTGKAGGTTLGLLAAADQTPMLPGGDALPAGDSVVPPGDAYFTATRIKQDVGRSGFVGFVGTDREFRGSHNRLSAVDAQLPFLGTWTATLQAGYSDTRNLDGTHAVGALYMADVSRNGAHLQADVWYNDLAPGFRADAGFIRRTDLREGGVFLAYQQRPDGAVVLRWLPALSYRRLYDHAGVLQDDEVRPQLHVQLAKQGYVDVSYDDHLERFADLDFHKHRVALSAGAAPSKLLSIDTYVEQGSQINYAPDSAYLGWSRDLYVGTTLRPNDNVAAGFTLTKSTFWRSAASARVFDVNIWRGKLTYQFSKELFLRAIGEWNSYDHTFDVNGLLSYTFAPGTVVFLGVDNGLEGPGGAKLQTMHRTVFFKASYLWRL